VSTPTVPTTNDVPDRMRILISTKGSERGQSSGRVSLTNAEVLPGVLMPVEPTHYTKYISDCFLLELMCCVRL
jgi:hypothetical protein